MYSYDDMMLSSMYRASDPTTPSPASIDQVNSYPTYNNPRIFNINGYDSRIFNINGYGQENFSMMSPRDFFEKPKHLNQTFLSSQNLIPSHATTS